MESEHRVYQSSITPRSASSGGVRANSAARAASIGHSGGGGRVLKMVTEMGTHSTFGISPELTDAGVKSYLQAAEREKKEMQGLNERLGNYIDRVKSLEERNRRLVADLDDVRGRWGADTSEIKVRHADNLMSARKDMDDEARRKAELDTRLARLQDELREARAKRDDLASAGERDSERVATYTAMVSDAEHEASMLRGRIKALADDHTRLAKDNATAAELLDKTRNDLDEETLSRIDFQNQVQTLMEELEFLRRVHDQEMKELQALLTTQPADTKEFFKNEIALAIRDIKDEYENIAHQGKSDMESWYKLKVSEVQNAQNRLKADSTFQRDEVNRLRNNIGDARGKLGDMEDKNNALEQQVKELTHQLEDDSRQYESALNERDAALRKMRDECQMLVAELQTLLDTKQLLDTEIAIYRKMLEGEESRAGLRQMVEEAVKSKHTLHNTDTTETTRSARAEKTTRTTFQRSAKGNVAIADCDVDGKYITVENTHRSKDETLSGWKLKRRLDGRKELVYTFPANTVVPPGETVKVWSRCAEAIANPPRELVFEGETSWGSAAGAQTLLLNRDGEERATFTQRTVAAK